MYVLNGCPQLQDIHTSFAIYSQGKLQGYLHSGEVGERCMQQVLQNRVQESYLDPSGWSKNCYWMRMEHDRNLHALHLANVLHVNMFIKLDFKDFPQNPILLRKRLVPLQVFANNEHGSCSMYGRKCIWCSMWCDLAACQGNDFYEHMDVCVCVFVHSCFHMGVSTPRLMMEYQLSAGSSFVLNPASAWLRRLKHIARKFCVIPQPYSVHNFKSLPRPKLLVGRGLCG